MSKCHERSSGPGAEAPRPAATAPGTTERLVLEFLHEVNQPLCAIANFAQGSIRRLRGGATDPAALLAAIEHVAAEASRAAEVVRRLRERIAPPRLDAAPIDVERLVRRVARGLSDEARRAGVSLHVDPASRRARFAGPADAIELVLTTLLRHRIAALRCVPAAGSAIRLTVQREADRICVVLCDDAGGAGGDSHVSTAGAGATDSSPALPGLAAADLILRACGGRVASLRDQRGVVSQSLFLPLEASLAHPKRRMIP